MCDVTFGFEITSCCRSWLKKASCLWRVASIVIRVLFVLYHLLFHSTHLQWDDLLRVSGLHHHSVTYWQSRQSIFAYVPGLALKVPSGNSFLLLSPDVSIPDTYDDHKYALGLCHVALLHTQSGCRWNLQKEPSWSLASSKGKPKNSTGVFWREKKGINYHSPLMLIQQWN